ncbi:uncharacterized protein LOC143431179 [Xylocopa sonorina]|uniref:uncharacterized protein LOC143431179 n=1 Tax=Xylocopa sonorina TaxID=1818115 RepID=UPI00403AFC7D
MLSEKHDELEISRNLFRNEDNTTLRMVRNSSPGINKINVFDYLKEYGNRLEIGHSAVNLSTVLTHNSDINLQADSINNDYKSNMELEFLKVKNIALEDMLKHDCTEQNGLEMKSESMEPIASPDIEIKDKLCDLETKVKNLKDGNNDPEMKCKASNDESKMRMNNLNVSNKQVKACSQCSMTFRYKRHLDRHLEGHQKNNCSHCNAKFARRKHLEIHLFRSHGERVTKYPHSCDTCSRSFPKRVLLNRHRAKHNYENGKVCSDCGEMLKAEEDDKEHKENHCTKKQFKCKRCLQTFSIKQTYLTHIQNHNNHKCAKCDVTFASKKKAHEHYKLVHSSKLNQNKISKNGIYFCTDCRHTFLKKDDYSRHLDSASHLNKVNKEIPLRNIFTCLICLKKLISQRALDQHIRRIHKGEKRFACDIYGCAFQCARKSDLIRHKQLHIEQRNIICEHCGKTFTSVSILNDHVLYIHNKERQFICEECGKAFKRNSLLKRHKLSHQQYRPFACMQCTTAFKRSHHLTRHMETCHKITLERKKKVVKLMKTEDGHLVPIPEKPRKLKPIKLKTKAKANTILTKDDKSSSFQNTNIVDKNFNSNLEAQTLPDSDDLCENSILSLELTNLLSNTDSISQVLSLVDINAEQIVTVEVSNPKTLTMNGLIDQFETNCNEILNLTNYQDSEYQHEMLNVEQNLYDHTNYSELSLGTVEGASLFVDSNINKMDTSPIESYLNQSFPSFLNF